MGVKNEWGLGLRAENGPGVDVSRSTYFGSPLGLHALPPQNPKLQ